MPDLHDKCRVHLFLPYLLLINGALYLWPWPRVNTDMRNVMELKNKGSPLGFLFFLDLSWTWKTENVHWHPASEKKSNKKKQTMHTRYLTFMEQEERQHHNNTGSRWIRPTDLCGVTPSPDIRFPSLFVRFHWLFLFWPFHVSNLSMLNWLFLLDLFALFPCSCSFLL